MAKRLCNDAADGILVWGNPDKGGKLLVLDYDSDAPSTKAYDKFRVFSIDAKGKVRLLAGNLTLSNALRMFNNRMISLGGP